MDEGQLFGRGIAFPPRIGPDGRLQWSEGSQNIRESIEIILLTEPGERVMLQRFGAGLAKYLFEPNTASTRRLIQEAVQNALGLWEPRIRVQQVEVEPDANDPQRVNIKIVYRLVATRATEEIGLSLVLDS